MVTSLHSLVMVRVVSVLHIHRVRIVLHIHRLRIVNEIDVFLTVLLIPCTPIIICHVVQHCHRMVCMVEEVACISQLDKAMVLTRSEAP